MSTDTFGAFAVQNMPFIFEQGNTEEIISLLHSLMALTHLFCLVNNMSKEESSTEKLKQGIIKDKLYLKSR